MTRCPICYANVEDVARHQKRSQACQIYAEMRRYKDKGWKQVIDLGSYFDRELKADLDKDGRLAVAPSYVSRSWGGIYVCYAVWAMPELGFADKLGIALDKWMGDQMAQAGGRVPYWRKVAKWRDIGHTLFEELARWVRDGCIDRMIEHYHRWKGPSWRDVPEYVNDRRVTCDRCGRKVLPSSLRRHYKSASCVDRFLLRTQQSCFWRMDDPQLADHPVWKALEDLGVPVRLVPLRSQGGEELLAIAPDRFRHAIVALRETVERVRRKITLHPYTHRVDRDYLDRMLAELANPSRDWYAELLASCLACVG